MVGEDDLDLGMGAMEDAERLGEAMVDRPGDADPQPPVEHPAQRGDGVATARGCRERGSGVRQQRVARRGQPRPVSIAVEQGLPELALEAADLRAECRLGHRHAMSRARELTVLGNRDEVGKLPQIHKQTLWKAS